MTGSILKLAASRGAVIAISFATAPLLGRLFPPHAYGALGVLSTILSITAGFATLSYVSAIPLAASPLELRNLFVLCSIIAILATGVVTVGSLLGANLLATAFHEPDVARFVLFLPLMFLVDGIQQLIGTTLSCQKRFGAVAIRGVLEIIVTRIIQLGSHFFGLISSPIVLIIGSLSGSIVSASASSITSVRDVFRTVKEPLRPLDLRTVALKHRKFPLVPLWSGTLNAITLGLPAIVLGMSYSIEVVGLYGMAFAMAALPLQLFVSGASQVFYVEAGQLVAQGQSAAPATMHLVRLIAILTSLPLATLLILGPLLFEIFLGPKWQEAGVFAQMLVPWMALVAVNSPLSVAFLVCNRQGEGFNWNIALLAGRFSALYFGGMFYGVRATLGLFVAVSVLLVAGYMWRSLSFLGVSRRWATQTIASAYLAPLLLLAPAGILYWEFSARFAALAVLPIACSAYIVLTYFRHPEIMKPVLARVPVAWVARLGNPAGAFANAN